MCCDDGISGLTFGNGYHIEKCYFDDLPFKNRIVDGKGRLITEYVGSRLFNGEKMYFYCIVKEDIFQIQASSLRNKSVSIADEALIFENELTEYMDNEMAYLNEKINLLRVYKMGNIGFRNVYFIFNFTPHGFVKHTVNHNNFNTTRNVVDDTKFVLSDAESIACNQWLNDYSGEIYDLMKDCIDKFSWGMEQIDVPTGFEQYTTALEMMLLKHNQHGRKQALANRISALLGKEDEEIQRIHQNILEYYRFRSESLHDGDNSNITKRELKELEQITRQVLRKCLMHCKIEYNSNPGITWYEIKNMIIKDLVEQVTELKNAGVL